MMKKRTLLLALLAGMLWVVGPMMWMGCGSIQECMKDTDCVAPQTCDRGVCKENGKTGNGCDYNNKHYKVGAGFPSTDGCNTCSCRGNGQVICTLRACVTNCQYNGKEHKEGTTFPSTDGCNTCSCLNGKVACTEKACTKTCGGIAALTCKNKDEFCLYSTSCGGAHPDQAGVCTKKPQKCTQEYAPVCGCDGKTYSNTCHAHGAGTSVKGSGKCTVTPPNSCKANGKTYKIGETWKDSDGCNTCVCMKDGISCTGKACTKSCTVNNRTYKDGEKWKHKDGCNTCTCQNGQAICTEMTCTKTCDGRAGNTCSAKEYCDNNLSCGFDDGQGTCQPRPGSCTKEYAPVCGCDNKTYGNACMAHAAGFSYQHKGECKTPPNSCKANGQVYKDGQTWSDGCNTCTCKNGQALCTKRACKACGGIAGIQCTNKGEFCSYGSHCGRTDQMGICITKPQQCTAIYAPVCGCNGKTYGNSCTAASNGVSVKAKGQCAP